MAISDVLNDKRILIFGYGREGKSTETYIKEHVKYKSLDVFEGKKEDIDENKYDVIIKSPGIVMLEENPKYTSQTELFLNEYGSQTVGVTGTKGKSTTSSLLNHVLNECGKKSILLGNIGKPCFDMIDEIKENTVIVFELSCHQLLHITKAPHIAVFLNLFEEHLDYYGTMDRYFGAKANIISHQTALDVAYVGENVPEIISDTEKQVIYNVEHDFQMAIPGEHNKLNAEFVFRIAVDEFMCDPGSVIEAISTFKGLPHRLEYFFEKNGIRFYDDSISTIPEAAISAVNSIENAKVIIIGGMDRGIDYDILVDFIKDRSDISFILCYATGKRIYNAVNGIIEDENAMCNNPGDVCVESKYDNCIYVEDLDKAFNVAAERANAGEAIVLSPAAPSYGYFKNFEERGEYFKTIVKNHYK